jgi:hypothetical protein
MRRFGKNHVPAEVLAGIAFARNLEEGNHECHGLDDENEGTLSRVRRQMESKKEIFGQGLVEVIMSTVTDRITWEQSLASVKGRASIEGKGLLLDFSAAPQ